MLFGQTLRLAALRQWSLLQCAPRSGRLVSLLLGLLVGVTVCASLTYISLERQRASFSRAAETVRDQVETRLKVADTLTSALAEVAALPDGASRWPRFAVGMAGVYPFVTWLGVQHRSAVVVEDIAERPAIGSMQALLAPLPSLDMFNDPLLSSAIKRSLRSRRAEPTEPFTLNSGQQVLAFVQAVGNGPYHQVRQVALALIDVRTLLPDGPQTPEAPTVKLLLAGQPDSIQPAPWYQHLLHLFSSEASTRVSISMSNYPYDLVYRQRLGWTSFPGVIVTLSMLLGGCASYLSWVLYALRSRYQQQRQIAAAHLRRERDQAASILESINDGVITVDTQWRIRYLNPMAERLIGVRHSRATGRPVLECLELHYDFARQVPINPFHACLTRQTPYPLAENCFLVQPDGQQLMIEGVVSPLFDQNGKQVGAVMAFRDTAPLRRRITEALAQKEQRLKQREAELARVARINTMGEMASGIAHELTQPLSAIVSYCHACQTLVDEDELDQALLRRALSGAMIQAERAGSILHRLREFMSEKRLEPTPVDLNQAVQNVLSLAEFELGAQQVHVSTRLTKPLPLIYADPIQIEQVLLNLVKNALDALDGVHPWGRLELISGFDATHVHIDVVDNGCGISPDALLQLFDPFFSTKIQGMGLGLTICQTIVESFGGRLSASSPPNGGAAFRMALPIFNTTGQDSK
ncbi:ATP-binding protein [Crenobacter sp. SG2305]|uniref:PAS domain-containing sensor histidine kinase n=1 Tax=Crenobacter oryzisoli TaxID=3056844 RepID=UPI0025AAB3E0|nr:ATP-binding protein [Crenobacter sp. SG2305]MDN0081936.1 ATP-binding protein [Crenobacter sp. SG2305]